MIELPPGFLDVPLVELERYGLSIRVINRLEENWGAMFVRDIRHDTKESVAAMDDMGVKWTGDLVEALRRLRLDMLAGRYKDE